MDKLQKKLKKLEKEYERNPLAVLKNARIMKKASKIMVKIEERKGIQTNGESLDSMVPQELSRKNGTPAKEIKITV